VSVEEMHAVARYLAQKGRVSIAELSAESGSLIDLEPKKAEVAGPASSGPTVDFEAMLAEEQ
jgi:hypothetical protein